MGSKKGARSAKVASKPVSRRTPSRARIWMLRHGQAQGNLQHVFNGSRIDAPLTNLGMAQAGRMAMHFPFRPDAIFSSPLLRAMQTAKPLSERFGMEILRLPSAMEQDYGSMSGMTRKELMAPKFRRYFHFSPAGHMVTLHARGGGESWKDLQARARRMFRWLDKHYAGKKIVVVSHSDFINCCYGVRHHLQDQMTWRRDDVPNVGTVRL